MLNQAHPIVEECSKKILKQLSASLPHPAVFCNNGDLSMEYHRFAVSIYAPDEENPGTLEIIVHDVATNTISDITISIDNIDIASLCTSITLLYGQSHKDRYMI